MASNTGLTNLDLSVMSLNVRGLHDKSKRRSIFQYIKDKLIDIACLQETYCTSKDEKSFNYDWGGKIFHCLSDSVHSRGVTILIRKGLDCEVKNVFKSNDGRKIMINIEIQNEIITIVNLYAPNIESEQKKFLHRSRNWIVEHSNTDYLLIVTGDFNCSDDKKHLIDFRKNLQIYDIWKKLNPTKAQNTWTDPSDLSHGSRIDYIFSTGYVCDKITKSCDINPAPTPDHDAVIVKLSCSNRERGKGYWKLNTSVLKEEEYVKGIKKVIKQVREEHSNDLNCRQLWDLAKVKIREFSIKYCKNRSQKNSLRIKNIENKIKTINERISDEDISRDVRSQLYIDKNVLQSKFRELYEDKARGYQVRSRAKWIADGEKNTSYFLKLEKRHQKFNKIDCLNINGTPRYSDQEILEGAGNFYKSLYTSINPSDQDIHTYLADTILEKQLTMEDKQKCEGLITANECKNAIKMLKLNKSPGLDGIPSDFYHVFCDDILDMLVKCFNESFENGALSESQKISVLSLIFKKGDREKIENYRPISLSNYDYKILAFILAGRMQKVLNGIISEDQTGYIKKRFIGNNIRIIEDLIDYIEKVNIGGVILFLDFQKAFDTVEWKFMMEVLNKFNFGKDFIDWIKVLYNTPKATIKNNGWLSESFTLNRGIRQGCPVSALLFLLVVEILAIKIKSDPNFKGISLIHKNKLTKYKVRQFADDMSLFLYSPDYIQNALDIITPFSYVSGLKLNMSKTEALGIGIYKNIEFDTKGLKLAKTPVRCLGIFIGFDKTACYKLNWENKLKKFQEILDQWRTRELTLFGKVQILKSLAVSQFTYLMTNLPTDDTTLNLINKSLYSFLWNKTDRIKRRKLLNPIEKGGISMIDIFSYAASIKASWVKRILESKDENLKFIANIYFNLFEDFDNHIVLRMKVRNIQQLPVLEKIPTFYKQVILGHIGSTKDVIEDDSTSEILFGNPKFMIGKKKHAHTLFFPNWVRSSLIYLKDLKYENGKLDTNYILNLLHRSANTLIEIHKMQNAITLFIKNKSNTPTLSPMPPLQGKTSKAYYDRYIQNVSLNVSLSKWGDKLGIYVTETMLINIFTLKVKNIQEKKIAEFNFKILHNILACKSLVSKWEHHIDQNCEICNVKEDIVHLLCECTLAKLIWQIFQTSNDIILSNKVILFGTSNSSTFNYMTSFVGFTLYKFWMVKNSESKARNIRDIVPFFKAEVQSKYIVYKHLGDINLANCLLKFLDDLENA